jgi:hypothetical protein
LTLTWLWEQESLLWGLGVFSVVTFIGTLIILPVVIARLPADYFIRDQHHTNRRYRQPGLRGLLGLLGLLCKNVLGLLFILAGIAMLLLPGQGILTILIGLALMNFPGQRTLQRRIAQQPSVLRTLNWMRAKAHQPPFEILRPEAQTPKATATRP